jgi:type IV secretory pathway VirB2 component (pilin)
MDPFIALLTGFAEGLRGPVWLVASVVVLCIVGYRFMVGDDRGGKAWGIGWAVGSAAVLGAPKISAWVQGLVGK